jgi:hypothetical protein
MLTEPNRMWRIITSPEHSTVWDGDETLFDLNFQAMGLSPQECFHKAFKRRLKPGQYLNVYFAEHHKVYFARIQAEAVPTAVSKDFSTYLDCFVATMGNWTFSPARTHRKACQLLGQGLADKLREQHRVTFRHTSECRHLVCGNASTNLFVSAH